MEFDLSDFITVERNTGRSLYDLWTRTVRVSEYSIGIGPEVANGLKRDDDPPTRVHLKVAYSSKHNALLIERDKEYGFSFIKEKGGALRLAGLPRHLKELKVARGVYRPAESNPNIFVYDAEALELYGNNPKARWIKEDNNIAIGDIVSWPYRLAGKGPTALVIVTGQVKSIVPGTEDEEALVSIESFSETYTGLPNPVVPKSKLIIREKYNGK